MRYVSAPGAGVGPPAVAAGEEGEEGGQHCQQQGPHGDQGGDTLSIYSASCHRGRQGEILQQVITQHGGEILI